MKVAFDRTIDHLIHFNQYHWQHSPGMLGRPEDAEAFLREALTFHRAACESISSRRAE
jgi:hypothetical protein